MSAIGVKIGKKCGICGSTARTGPFILALFAVFAALIPPSVADAASQQDTEPARVAYAGELSAANRQTVLRIDFDGVPDFRIFFMDDPYRFVLELTNAAFALDAGELVPAGIISNLRFGQVSADKARLVATLGGPAEAAVRKIEALDGGQRRRLTLELAGIDEAGYRAILAKQRAEIGSSGQVVVKGDRVRPPVKEEGRFAIVIDPGHGGIDGGATGRHGVMEKELTLTVSKLIGDQIAKAGPFDVNYTRTEDIFVSLAKRQSIARRHEADLLLSVHADSLRQKSVRGSTIYTLARNASDKLAKQVADSENLADVVAGLAIPEAQDTVTDILADLTLRETTIFSRSFSDHLAERLADKVNLINNPQRSASFLVLKNAEIPGVLLELGYLSNNEDEKLLSDPAWQRKIAVHIAEAVADFFAPRIEKKIAN